MANPGVKRSQQLKVTLTPDMHARLVRLAERLGQTPATVGSMAIGLYVSQQENALGAGDRAIAAVMDRMGPELVEQLRLLKPNDDPRGDFDFTHHGGDDGEDDR